MAAPPSARMQPGSEIFGASSTIHDHETFPPTDHAASTMSDEKTLGRPVSPVHNSKKRQRQVEDCTHRRTRTKLNAVTTSSASESSVSDQSALIPTSVPNDSTDASNVEIDSDDSSDVSESSQEPSSESSSEDNDESDSHIETDNEDAIVNLRANRGKKPKIKLGPGALGPDITSFLKDFLPQLKAANERLEVEREAGTLKDMEIERENDVEGDVGEHYIEMVGQPS